MSKSVIDFIDELESENILAIDSMNSIEDYDILISPDPENIARQLSIGEIKINKTQRIILLVAI